MNLRRSSILLVLLAPAALAVDRADLDGTSIRGSRELPKVLYIVPWKKPVPGDLVGRPVASLLDETLAPVDREVFRRELEYHERLSVPSAATAAAAPER